MPFRQVSIPQIFEGCMLFARSDGDSLSESLQYFLFSQPIHGANHVSAAGSWWYFPQAYKLLEHGKYLLMAPGIDRSGAVGFRCVINASADAQSTLPSASP